jgi:hypothetical protein
MATTKDSIKTDGGSCTYVATNFWECTDKNGKKWWCDDEKCEPAPKRFGLMDTVRVQLDLRVMKDKETDEVVVVMPLASEPKGRRTR